MSFILLVMALAAFDIRAEQANRQALSVHFEDIANRVANAVLGAADIGVQRSASEGTAPSDELTFRQSLRIPTQIRGQGYSITLTEELVTVQAEHQDISEDAPLFNLQIPNVCDHDDAVCELTGTTRSAQGFVLLKYEYKRAGASTDCVSAAPVSCISIG